MYSMYPRSKPSPSTFSHLYGLVSVTPRARSPASQHGKGSHCPSLFKLISTTYKLCIKLCGTMVVVVSKLCTTT